MCVCFQLHVDINFISLCLVSRFQIKETCKCYKNLIQEFILFSSLESLSISPLAYTVTELSVSRTNAEHSYSFSIPLKEQMLCKSLNFQGFF